MSDVKDFEPLIALTDNKDGLSFYSRISSINLPLPRKMIVFLRFNSNDSTKPMKFSKKMAIKILT